MKINQVLIIVFVLSLFSCEEDKPIPTSQPKDEIVDIRITPPVFNSDSALHFVQTQVDFGPRVPNSDEHAKCAEYLANKLTSYGAEVIVQEADAKAFNGATLHMKNIIGQFNPKNEKRILLCAHWDTRPFADKDQDQSKHGTPIDGANDGASGVGVLLEVARALQQKTPEYGVDIIFFDAEDYGALDFTMTNFQDYKSTEETWCLGSQYWSKNPHKKGYKAKYGILLDMVGAENAVFPKEGYSLQYASKLVNYVWNRAHDLGYGNYFQKRVMQGYGGLIDDHLFINKYAGIPAIDIIHYDMDNNGFGFFHHTHQDNMDVIDPNTLKAVGEVVLDVVYNEE